MLVVRLICCFGERLQARTIRPVTIFLGTHISLRWVRIIVVDHQKWLVSQAYCGSIGNIGIPSV
jgi:hypothetical protein